ncbi:hypothetical protein LguiB_014073 [Lonicera macranthoides]
MVAIIVEARWLDFKVTGPFAAECKHAFVDAMGHADATVWWNRVFQSLAACGLGCEQYPSIGAFSYGWR